MRRRILALVVGMTVLVVLAFAIPLAIVFRNNAYDGARNDLSRDTKQVASYLRAYNTVRTTGEISTELAKVSDDRAASVRLPSGALLGSRPPGGFPDLPTSTFNSGNDGRGPGGFDGGGQNGGGGGPTDPTMTAWHGGLLTTQVVPAFGQQGFYVVRIYESTDSLRSGETAPWLILAAASVFLILLGTVLGELLTRRIVRPLLNTADTAQRLAAGDVTARATTSGPDEVADVGRALNRLADRIDQLIAEERETVADLSHRLRTPLTALRLDAEALGDDTDAERIGGHVTALERMLTAVIRAARRPQREGRMPSCDATSVVADRVAFWSALAEDQGRACELALPDRPTPVRAADEDLAAAVDALLENVIAHTPEEVSFAVRLSVADGRVQLEVSDEGPGLPDTAPVRGRSDRGSSGLGLDIARRCAEASGGSMTLGTSPGGGASITLDLGAP